MRKNLLQAIRRFVVSALYFTPFVLATTSIVVNHATFPQTILILSCIGTGIWGVASIHSLTRQTYLLHQSIKDGDDIEEVVPTTNCLVRGSTHTIFNNMLHIHAAALYIAIDAIYLSEFSPIILTRLLGSILWEKSVLIGLALSFLEERKKENDPDVEIKIIGLPPEVFRLICDLDFLVAGGLYAYGIFSLNNNLRKGYVVSWLLASSIDTVFDSVAIAMVCSKNESEDVVELARMTSV